MALLRGEFISIQSLSSFRSSTNIVVIEGYEEGMFL